MAHRAAELNRAGVALAKEAARLHGQQVWIAGSMGPLAPEKLGLEALGAGAAQQIFAEQAAALAEAGADLLILETFGSLAQLRLAVAAAKSAAGLPVIAQLTFNDDGLTRDGDSPEDAAAALSAEDVIAIGANCSVGPYAAGRALERMAEASDLPLSWQPNAGLPTYEERRLRYTASPAYFADLAREAVRSGAAVLGGCCGTTPEHVTAMRDAVRGVASARTQSAPRRPARPAAKPEALPPTTLASRLERGEFVVTVELSPPRGFDIGPALDKLRSSAGLVDAVNVSDNPLAQGRMSALATSSLVQSRLGVETIMHLAIRHRNLLALHSDLLGAHALGVRNVFTVMGDAPLTGDYPSATAVSDVTASGLIRLIAGFNQGVDAKWAGVGLADLVLHRGGAEHERAGPVAGVAGAGAKGGGGGALSADAAGVFGGERCARGVAAWGVSAAGDHGSAAAAERAARAVPAQRGAGDRDTPGGDGAHGARRRRCGGGHRDRAGVADGGGGARVRGVLHAAVRAVQHRGGDVVGAVAAVVGVGERLMLGTFVQRRALCW